MDVGRLRSVGMGAVSLRFVVFPRRLRMELVSRFEVGHYWWRPAMVGFFGFGGGVGFGVGFGFGNVGWVPLAPYEAFHPWYGQRLVRRARRVGRGHVEIVSNVNIYEHVPERAVRGRCRGGLRAGFSARRIS